MRAETRSREQLRSEYQQRAEAARQQLRELYPVAVERLGKLVAHEDPAVALKACALVLQRVIGDSHTNLTPFVPTPVDDLVAGLG